MASGITNTRLFLNPIRFWELCSRYANQWPTVNDGLVPFLKLLVPLVPYLETGGSNGSLPETVGSKGFFTHKLVVPIIFQLETDQSSSSIFRKTCFHWFPS